jgi:hypothetical protein
MSDTMRCGIPCDVGYHAMWDTMRCGIPCDVGYHAVCRTSCDVATYNQVWDKDMSTGDDLMGTAEIASLSHCADGSAIRSQEMFMAGRSVS